MMSRALLLRSLSLSVAIALLLGMVSCRMPGDDATATGERASGSTAKRVDDSKDPVWTIPVVSVRYFPVKGDKIDIEVTGDWGDGFEATRRKVDDMEKETIASLTEGSRYHAYGDPDARPSMTYKVIKSYEFIEALPTVQDPNFKDGAGRIIPKTDYNAIMARIDAKHWVEKKGVREIWLWAYHGGKVVLWESNMSSPYGDVSNSNRDPNDLPVFKNTYTVYHYNYQRSTHEAVHDHFHQIEHLLNHVDGRHTTPPEKWNTLLFWGNFVGSDVSHKIVREGGCGWGHYPPNGEQGYDYSNKRYVMTEIEDWKPDGSGRKVRINCDRWEGNDLKFYIYWYQSLPGYNNKLMYEGKELENWWLFKADWDYAMKHGLKLVKQ